MTIQKERAKYLIEKEGAKIVLKGYSSGEPLFAEDEKGGLNNPIETVEEIDELWPKTGTGEAAFWAIMGGKTIDWRFGEFNGSAEDEFQATRGLKAQIESWIEDEDRIFTVEQLDRELGIKEPSQKNYRKQVLHELVKKGVIEKTGNKRGIYRAKNNDFTPFDFTNVDETEVSLPLPLDISNHAALCPGDMVVFAGAFNAGKTGFVLNTIHDILNSRAIKLTDITGDKVSRNAKLGQSYFFVNDLRNPGLYKNAPSKPVSVLLNEQLNGISEPVPVLHMSSEGNVKKYKRRMNKFPGGLDSFISHKNFTTGPKMEGFQDIIEPNGINIIDYLRIYDDFWRIGEILTKILEKLENGIVIVCIQKRSDKDFARGGEFAIENSALTVNLDNNVAFGHMATITKLKEPIGIDYKWRTIDYRFEDGINIIPMSDWRYIRDKKHRNQINAEYEAEMVRGKAAGADEETEVEPADPVLADLI